MKEARKLQRMSEMHPSYGMARNYLETLASVPFNQWSPRVSDDFNRARQALDKGHFGLENAKQRILEYIAVQKLNKQAVRGPVLCFVGPPGVGLCSSKNRQILHIYVVGKTSLAQGMAKALNRKYVRVSLGGVRDEAEIRGHRRTYIGAMPGRIVSVCRYSLEINVQDGL